MPWRRRKDREQDLERELRSDLELEAEEQQERGLSAEEARLTAHRALGNTTLVKEDVREMWGWTRWDILMQDFRYALRMLRKNPGFAFTAVLTLALGIGASTAVFTLVDSIVLEPLAYRDGGSLVVAWERVKFLGSEPTGPNPRHVDLWRQRATSFSGLALLRHGAAGLTLGTAHPQLVGTVTSLPNLFEVLQVAPLLGRTFLPDDAVKGHDQVAILTYSLWQTSFLGDPNVIGKTVRLADTPREIIGVLPPDFHFPNKNSLRAFRSRQPASSVPEPAIFVPAVMDLNEYSWNGEYGNWVAVARLKPGVGIRQAAAQLATIEAQIVRETPAGRRDDPDALLTSLQPMQEAVVGDSKTGLWFLMAAVIGLMLIACVNLANAQVGRTLSRQRDAAVRAALGAAKWRLVWNSLAENLVLAAAGGVAGVILAAVGIELLSPPRPRGSSAIVRGASQPDRAPLLRDSHPRFEHPVRRSAGAETPAYESAGIPPAGQQPHPGEQAEPPAPCPADWPAGLRLYRAPAGNRPLREKPAQFDAPGKRIRDRTRRRRRSHPVRQELCRESKPHRVQRCRPAKSASHSRRSNRIHGQRHAARRRILDRRSPAKPTGPIRKRR